MSAFDRRRKAFEDVYRKRIERELKRYGKSIALQIEEGVAPETFLLSGQFLSREKLDKTLRNLWETTGSYFVGYSYRRLRRLKIDVPEYKTWGEVVNQHWKEAGSERLNDIVTVQEDNIKKTILKTIEEGQKEGLGISQISKNVTKKLTGSEASLTAKFNATRIARTEVMMASNRANHEQNLEAGDKVLMMWETAGDRWVRDSHAFLQGATRENKPDATYPQTLYGNRMRYPGDTRATANDIINCRCGERPVPNPNL